MPTNPTPSYPDGQFDYTTFIDVPDPQNPPPGALELDSDELQKIGKGISDTRDGLHLAHFRLPNNAKTAFDPIDAYRKSSVVTFWVNHASWGVAGRVETVRERGDETSDATVKSDYQTLKVDGSNEERKRFANTKSKTPWAPNTTAVANVTVVQPLNAPNGCYYICTVGGTTKGTEPVWPTADNATVTETDAGGANPTVTWRKAGEFWSKWDTVLNAHNPRFTGTFSSEPLTHALANAGDKIPVTARHISVTSSVADLVLNGTDILLDGLNGQEVIVTNVGANSFGLTSGAANNLSLSTTVTTLRSNESITLRYSQSLGLWVQLNTANVAPRNNPAFTGTITNVPVSQALAAAANTINPLSSVVLITVTGGANLTLNGANAIGNGLNGQILTIINAGPNTLTFTHGDANNVRLRENKLVNLNPNEGITFVFVSSLGGDGVWVQVTTAGLMSRTDPTFNGLLSGPNFTLSNIFFNTPTAAQAIAAAATAIVADGSNKLVSNTTAASITLNAVPTLADGANGQEIRITNTGTANIVLQDQATLAGSNMKLGAATRTLTPRSSIRLQFLSAIGDWVEIGFSSVL